MQAQENLNVDVAETDFVPVTMEDLVEWDKLVRKLAEVKAAEMELRTRIAKTYFKNAKEGTNDHNLGAGWLLKMQRKIDRKVDIGNLQAMSAPDQLFWQNGINANELIEWEPKLKVKPYRALPEEKRKIFDQCLIIKDGAPQMSITLPARAAAKRAPKAA